jgi:hypothetical protein
MTDIRGRVLEIKRGGDLKVAYLYGFKIDRPELRQEHKKWLDLYLIKQAEHQASMRPPWRKIWHVWVCGTTSRTGGWGHNWGLSEHRNNAVTSYIAVQFLERGMAGNLIQHPIWVGESSAVLRGRPDEDESALDRAVIIAFLPADPYVAPPPPNPVDRDYFAPNNPCCAIKLEIEYLEILKDTWNAMLTFGGGKPGSISLDFSGDPAGPADVPRIELDSTHQLMMENFLRAKGWSPDRAKELSHWTQFTSTRIDEIHEKIRSIGREIDRLKEKQLTGCSDRDPLNFCTYMSRFRKINQVGDVDHPRPPPKPFPHVDFPPGKTVLEKDGGTYYLTDGGQLPPPDPWKPK